MVSPTSTVTAPSSPRSPPDAAALIHQQLAIRQGHGVGNATAAEADGVQALGAGRRCRAWYAML